jgi:hypothetical protein
MKTIGTFFTIIATIIAGAGAGTGCGGGGGSVSIDELPAKYASAYCMKAVECCTMDELAALNGGFGSPITDEASCESYYSGLFQAFFVGSLKASETMGRASYDGDAAGSCIDAAASLSCTAFANSLVGSGTFAGCGNPITPKVDDGGGCTQDYECTSDNCVGATQTADGMCMTKPAVGADCPDFVCADGAYCDFTSGKCTAEKADGMTCSSDEECTNACNGADPQNGVDGTCGAAMTCDGM